MERRGGRRSVEWGGGVEEKEEDGEDEEKGEVDDRKLAASRN